MLFLTLLYRGRSAMSFRRSSWSTVSKARERSIATKTALSTVLFWLRPVVMWLEISWRAVVAERPFRKQCWCGARAMEAWMGMSRMLSRTLAAGKSREMGL